MDICIDRSCSAHLEASSDSRDDSEGLFREKGRDLTQSYDKSPYTNRNVKRAK